jgi:hypothetical protein
LIRSAISLSALSLVSALACAQVVSEDPPSRLDAAQNGNVPAGTSTPQPPASVPSSPSPATPVPVNSGGLPASEVPNRNASDRPAPPAMVAPAAAVGPSGTLLLLDDFEDGNATGWIADAADGDDLVGSWAVVETDAGHAYAQQDDSFDDDSWAVGGDVAWTDVSLDVRFRFTSVADIEDAVAMIALRFRSKETYYFLEYGGDGAVKLRKRVDGSDSELSSQELDRVAVLGQWIEVNVTARGNTLEARVDGEQVASGVVDMDLTSGGIGLGVAEGSAVEFDDVRVTRP